MVGRLSFIFILFIGLNALANMSAIEWASNCIRAKPEDWVWAKLSLEQAIQNLTPQEKQTYFDEVIDYFKKEQRKGSTDSRVLNQGLISMGLAFKSAVPESSIEELQLKLSLYKTLKLNWGNQTPGLKQHIEGELEFLQSRLKIKTAFIPELTHPLEAFVNACRGKPRPSMRSHLPVEGHQNIRRFFPRKL